MSDQSSVSLDAFEVGDMAIIRHFTGVLLLSRYEMRHLRALLNDWLRDEPEMSAEEALRIVRERQQLVEKYTIE